MSFLTDRKRAVGRGASGTGTAHFWSMTKSSVALLVLVPLFIFTWAPMVGADFHEAMAFYRQPFPAIVALLTLTVGLLHFKSGAYVLIEDYVGGLTRKLLIIGVSGLSYVLIAFSALSILRIVL